MLAGLAGMAGPVIGPNSTMREVIRALNLETSLQLLLDAGDANSYDGSSQTWTDLSGNGNHFYRGSGSGSDAADPTFNGVAGRQSGSDYFGHDGGDWFTLAAGAAPAWQSALHKSGGAFTILQWAYVGNLTGLAPGQAGFGCGDNLSATDGAHAFSFSNSGTTQNAISVSVVNAVGSIWGGKSTIVVGNNAWQMIAVSLTVGSNPIRFAINGATEDINSAASGTPSSTDSQAGLVIGAVAPDGHAKAISGCRLAVQCLWTRALSATELVAVFNATRSKFSI
jgi:hypothetical protein